jgi:arylsulfatase A-like enzyme
LLNDHQAYYGHGKMAGGPPIQRPCFDSLCSGGVEFRKAYTAAPLCGPARRSMLTALLPHNHGEITNDANHPYDREVYLDTLAAAGYRNFYYGKWHAGGGTAHDHHCEGFSYPSYGNPYITPEYADYLKETGLPAPSIALRRSFQPWSPQALEESLRTGAPYVQNKPWCNEHATGILTTPTQTHEAFFLAHLACRKLRELAAEAKGGSPFHLRVDFWGPHQPYFPTQKFADLYNPRDIPEYPNFRDTLEGKPKSFRAEENVGISRNGILLQPNPLPWNIWQETLALCYAQITLVDAGGGLILRALEELGLAESTLVIWSTDHGDALACHGGHFDKDAYLPEEMLRIPLAVRLPGAKRRGRKSGHLVSNMDIPATILHAAGASFASPVDGRSLQPLCEDPKAPWRENLVCESHGHITHTVSRVLVTAKLKYVWNQGDVEELYDLEADPYEMRNLAGHADAAESLRDMRERLGREQTSHQTSQQTCSPQTAEA